MIRWALRYAAIGWPVLPLLPREKAPDGALVRRGVMQATTDPEVIRYWWSKSPNANIGLRAEPWNALDVDPRHNGDATIAALLAQHGPMPKTPTVATPSGGWHWYFSPFGFPAVGHLGKGVDVLQGARYLVAPPSIHPNGGVYRWTVTPRVELATVPSWLAELLRRPEPEPLPAPSTIGDPDRRMRRATAYAATCEQAVSGQRGSFVTMRVAGAIRRTFGLTVEEGLAALRDWNAMNVPPWSEAELRRKLRDAGAEPRGAAA